MSEGQITPDISRLLIALTTLAASVALLFWAVFGQSPVPGRLEPKLLAWLAGMAGSFGSIGSLYRRTVLATIAGLIVGLALFALFLFAFLNALDWR